MPTYKLTIEYEGTRYSGWQSQVNTPKTIQGRLMRIASEVFGASEIGGAGRTDAGVHAAGQVAHLRIHKAVDPILIRIVASHFLWKMVRKLVAYLVEIGRGAPNDLESKLREDAESFQPTAPPSGLFLEAITYGEPFTRPLASIVPVFSRR